jgi:hypothetical protein
VIAISKVCVGQYVATATPPHSKSNWKSTEPLRLGQLIDELQAQSCHQTDIGDALYEADSEWESAIRQ